VNSTTPAASPVSTGARPLRADARRNYEALLAAGRIVLALSGADAPLEEVARRAGVGQGTLYRHFPTREHLFVALLKERVDLLDRSARDLIEAPDPWQALIQWLQLYDQSAAEYRGMSMRLAEGLADDASPVAAACAPMKASFGALFDRAREAGAVRPDITALQVLTMISALPKDPERGTTIKPYLDIVLKGLSIRNRLP
jgi:AcrR family transcriptional regulator